MKKDNPGVYIPPPLIYVAFFFLSVFLQQRWPLGSIWPGTMIISSAGWLLITSGLLFIFPAIRRFVVSKNTLITVKPARSLQTTGIYNLTRNPMYLGLLLLYTGIAFFQGNGWILLLLPLLTFIVQVYIIRKEESYLQRTFGEQYDAYKKRVRTWI